jgi:hypothetical protein
MTERASSPPGPDLVRAEVAFEKETPA